MASTPSASALSAVLRCRGNIWTRNPPTVRPGPSAYGGLGLSGGAPAERARPNRASAWEAFLQGDRVSVGRRLAVAYKSAPADNKDSRDVNKLCHPKLSQSAVVPGVQSALVRQLARTLTPNLPGRDKCSQIIHKIKYGTCAPLSCGIIFVHEISEFPVLKVSVTSPCSVGHAGPVPSFVLTGWSTLKSTCLSLTALVSHFMFLKLAEFWRSSCSPDGASQHQNIRSKAPQIHSPTELTSEDDSGSGQMIPEDRPD